MVRQSEMRDWVNQKTHGALDSDNYRVYINEYGYPMVEPIQTKGERISDGIAKFVGLLIAMSLFGIIAVALLGVFFWIVLQVSSILFGGN